VVRLRALNGTTVDLKLYEVKQAAGINILTESQKQCWAHWGINIKLCLGHGLALSEGTYVQVKPV
jgi:hypothetical protein